MVGVYIIVRSRKWFISMLKTVEELLLISCLKSFENESSVHIVLCTAFHNPTHFGNIPYWSKYIHRDFYFLLVGNIFFHLEDLQNINGK